MIRELRLAFEWYRGDLGGWLFIVFFVLLLSGLSFFFRPAMYRAEGINTYRLAEVEYAVTMPAGGGYSASWKLDVRLSSGKKLQVYTLLYVPNQPSVCLAEYRFANGKVTYGVVVPAQCENAANGQPD